MNGNEGGVSVGVGEPYLWSQGWQGCWRIPLPETRLGG